MAIGTLVVKIGADIAGLRREVTSASSSLGSLQGAVSGVGSVLKVMAGAAAVAGLASLVKESLSAIDAQAKLSRSLGGTINGLKSLQLAAGDAGVDSSVLGSALEKLNQRLGEAARKGTGEAANALKTLGLSAQELSNADLDERMALIADRMRELGLSTQGTTDILRQLGVRQGEVVRMFLDGGEVIRAARGEIAALGLELSEIDAAKVEAANDAMERVKLATTAVTQRLAVSLAPVLEVAAVRMAELAKETGGFQTAINTAIEFTVKGFGLIGDAVHLVHIGLGGLSAAGFAMNAVFAEASADGMRALQDLAQGAVDAINAAIGAVNRLPGVTISLLDPVKESAALADAEEHAAAMQLIAEETRAKFRALRDEEWPSDKAVAFLNEIQAAAQAAASQAVSVRKALAGEAVGRDVEGEERQGAELEKLQAKLDAQLQALREYAMSEEQLLAARHEQRLAQLDEALVAERLTWQQFRDLETQLEEKHMAELAKTRERGLEKVEDISVSSAFSAVDGMVDAAEQLIGAIGKNNKEAFEAQKILAISSAVLAGVKGVALTMGEYPFPVNLAMATPHAAMAAAQVAAIASKSFGGSTTVEKPSAPAGGGGGRGLTGGVAGAGLSAGQGPQQIANINIQGDVFGRQQVLSLIEGINEAVGDGARLVVT